MELIKKINNNFAVARDSAGQYMIVSGKGIGFEKMPCKVSDLSKITRTYYDVDERYFNLIQQIPDDVIKQSIRIVDYASTKLNQKLNSNLFFTLADHINFAIKRARKGIKFKFGITYEMQYLHSEEMKIGEEVVKLINRLFQIELPKDEAAVIAMHILEAEQVTASNSKIEDIDEILNAICRTLTTQLGIVIHKNEFSYCRFVTHIQFLLQRRDEEKQITSDNKRIFKSMIEEFTDIYTCVLEVKEYFQEYLHWCISDEEMLYLMLHINRLCNNEDCNQ